MMRIRGTVVSGEDEAKIFSTEVGTHLAERDPNNTRENASVTHLV
jgi:hypothetical protein